MTAATAAAPAPSSREPFPLLVTLGLLAVGLAAFAAFVVLGAFAPDRGRDLRGGSALSDSAIGLAGLVELLRAEGVPVRIGRTGTTVRTGLLVLTPPATGAPLPRRLLDERTGPVLVILPKWSTSPLAGHPGWVATDGPLAPALVEPLLPAPIVLSRRECVQAVALHGGSGLLERERSLSAGEVDRLQTAALSADWTPVLLDASGQPVLLRSTGHRVYVLSDPDVANTHGLRDPETARTALTIVDALREDGPVTFDVTLNGFGAPPNLLRLLFEPPLLGATLCATAAGLLILLMALHRFGPVRQTDRVHEFGKRALADNSAGLIALARREPRMAGPYADLVRGLVLRDVGAPRRLDGPALDRLLDTGARSRGLGDDWSGLAAQARGVRRRADLVAVAARLHGWRLEMTRDRR